ncbi:Acyl-coenzyme A synthetase/AMP-(fatty) acid ligase [Rubellimicrobium thermophilum DSM 16684]|uniref:Acyl-coenzyme A synthetase/AMP-(Fatty) acid ligase n=1 Tax=Rubellimicrobium thermophilum DSM 16684 TaxID=1123069 RepID=S9QU87_9RHOB|nr:Acyl-coenzyme A synthetase/AMP-(fatty) acid ligase [Rubellimicrobium thermophilum DSM 16684]
MLDREQDRAKNGQGVAERMPRIDAAAHRRAYEASLADPDAFWREQSHRIDWVRRPTRIKNTSFAPGHISIRWFEDGTLNVAANCIDRHAARHGERTAIIWEPDDPAEPVRRISYAELLEQVCRMAGVLRQHGVGKGDRVVIYMPMIPEAAYAMLACARIGAIHSVVFGGFSPDALANRITDCDARVVITADTGPRGGRKTPLKQNVDAALAQITQDMKVMVVRRTGDPVPWTQGRDIDLLAEMEQQPPLLPLCRDGGRGSALHPLHLGIHRQAQGGGPYLRGLSRLCLAHA